MDYLSLMSDLHGDGTRQGPGGDDETLLAITLSGLDRSEPLKIADIGCGTGASTFVLANELNADITAIDLAAPMLETFRQRAESLGIMERINLLHASMDDLPFEDGALDVIWSEGAIYNIGFENGIQAWRRFLKPGGILAVSELIWLTTDRPDELTAHWDREYPEVAIASTKLKQLETHGYLPVGYFPLGKHCWLDNYYHPLESRFDAFLERQKHSADAKAIVEAEAEEIALYRRFSDYVSYGFYIARKFGD